MSQTEWIEETPPLLIFFGDVAIQMRKIGVLPYVQRIFIPICHRGLGLRFYRSSPSYTRYCIGTKNKKTIKEFTKYRRWEESANAGGFAPDPSQ